MRVARASEHTQIARRAPSFGARAALYNGAQLAKVSERPVNGSERRQWAQTRFATGDVDVDCGHLAAPTDL